MKYNININQLALSELSQDMDVIDAAVLDYTIGLCNSLSDKVASQRHQSKKTGTWTWIDLGSIIEDMPLLRILSKAAISTRLKKIENNGFLSIFKKRVNGHIRLYVKLDRKVDSLYVKLDRKVDSLYVKLNRPIRETEQALEKPIRETEPIIYTSNTIHHNTTTIELFDLFWGEYPNKVGKKIAEKSWLKINPAPELANMIIEDVVKRKLSDSKWLKDNGEYIPNPSTYLNQERWNDEIRVGRSSLPVGTPHEPGKYANERELII